MKHSFKNELMVILTLLLLMINAVGVTLAYAAANWEVVGTAGFSADQAYYPSLVVDHGIIYVAYRDVANGGKTTVMKFNRMSWKVVGTAGFSAGDTNYPSLAVDNGVPYVAYRDVANGGKATVMKFNGTSWEVVGTAGFSSGNTNYPSLAVDNGTPYVAYKDWGNGGKATVMKFNGTSWEVVGTAGFSAGSVYYTSLAIDHGTPYVGYQDWGNGGKATVMKFNGTNWVVVGTAGFSAAGADFPSLAVDNGTPYLAYVDGVNYKATVMKFNGTSWEAVGTARFSANEAYYPSLALYNGTPYVAYQDSANGYKATVMKFNGTSWEVVGTAGFSAADINYASLAIDHGTSYVAYMDWGNSRKATVMKYLTGPAAPNIDPIPSPTNDNTPTISGTAQAGSWVNVWYFDDLEEPVQICQDILVAGSGDWSCVSSEVLPDREVVLAVNAMDGDGVSEDVFPTFTVDTLAPQTQIDSQPNHPTDVVDAAFTFSSPDLTATFECQLDGGGFSACAGSQDYFDLEDGSHTFEVRARDAAGNVDATPASYTWIITTVPPVSAGSYDDADAAWTYAGSWASYNGAGPYGDTLRYTGSVGDSAELTFTGTKFILTFAKDFNRGSIDIFVDGNKVTTIDAYSASLAFQQTYTSPGYTNSLHIVRLVHAGGKPYIDIDAIQIFGAPVAVPEGTYDDGHAAWIYSGRWASYNGSGPSGNTLHYTDMVGSAAELTFTGTKFILTFTKDSNRGSIDVFVDGNKVTRINAYSASLAFQQSYTSPSFTSGTHTVRLVHATGSFIDMDAIEIVGMPVPVPVGIYDDADAAWSYSGSWASYSGAGPSANTLHYTSTVGDLAELTFTGTKFILTFTKDSNRGSVDVYVDGDKVTTIHAYAASLAFQQTYTSPSYILGTHTVRLVHAGGSFIDLDAIQIFGTLPAVPAGTYDDGDAAWSYSGNWLEYSGNGPAANTLHYTNTVGDSAELIFAGTQFILTFTKDSNRGLIDVYVDRNKVTTINAYSASLVFQQTYTSSTFASGTHTVRFVHAGGQPYIDIDAITILP